MAQPPKIVIPGLNRGAGVPPGYVLGRLPGTGHGPAQLLNLNALRKVGLATAAGATQSTSLAISTAQSLTTSLSTAVSSAVSSVTSVNTAQSTSLSQISSSLSGAISTNTGQSTSLSQISSSLSGAISSTTSLSTAVSTVISGSVSTLNSRIDSLSAAGGGGATTFLSLTDTPDSYVGQGGKEVLVKADESGLEFGTTTGTNQSTSLSQISSSLSSEISTRASADTSISTVISSSISTVNSRIDSLSTAVGSGGGGTWTVLGAGQTATGVWDFAVDGAKANVDFTGLAGSTDILLEMEAVTKASSGAPVVSVSVDNGSNWFTTSGDYAFMDTSGVRTNTTSIGQFHLTNTTAARDGIVEIIGANVPRAIGFNITANVSHRFFLASTSAINAVRINNSGGGNFTGGKFRCFGRL